MSAPRRLPSGSIALVVLVCVVTVPLAALVGAAMRDRPAALQSWERSEAVAVPVADATVTGERSVALALTWSDGRPVRSGGGDGIVTEVPVAPGSELVTGTVVARVDDVPVLALVSDLPIYRPLRMGDRGRDVPVLRSLLVAAGVLSSERSEGDQVDRWMVDAVVRLGGIPAGTPPDQIVFEPARALWLGPAPTPIGTLAVSVGAPWPAVGEPVLTAPAQLTAARVVAGTEGEAGPVSLPGGDLVFLGDDVEVPVGPDGSVAPDALPALAAALPGRVDQVEGAVRLATPRRAHGVPASAVLVTGDRSCVFQRSGGTWVPVPIEIVDTDFGRTLVQGELSGDDILANPQQALTDPSCDS